MIGRHQTPRAGEQQQQGMVGDLFRAIVGDVTDHDTPAAGGQ